MSKTPKFSPFFYSVNSLASEAKYMLSQKQNLKTTDGWIRKELRKFGHIISGSKGSTHKDVWENKV